jgi:hypothetical protein
MEAHSSSGSRGTTSEAQAQEPTRRVRSEDIYVRNYDSSRGYRLTVSVNSERGTTVFRERFYLRPGQVESLGGVLRAGSYRVAVTLDTDSEDEMDCRVGTAPAETIHVEIGNGIVTLTEGLDA